MRSRYPKKACRQCRVRFDPVRDWHVFCSESCRERWHTELYEEMKHARLTRTKERQKKQP